MADYWGQLTDPASVYESIYGEPFVSQSPSIVTPGGGRVTGYQDDPSISGYTPALKSDRYSPPTSFYNQAPSIVTPAGGRVRAYQDDPSISGYTPGPKTDRLRAPSIANPTSGTTYYPQTPGVEYGYNTSTGDYEVKRAGQAYTSVPGRSAASPKGGSAPSVANPLPSMPYGLKPFTGSDPFDAYKGDYAASAKPASLKSGDVIKLTTEPMSAVSGQNTANSFGKPVRGPSGKTYYPSNTPMSGVRAPYDPKGAEKYSGKMGQDNRGPLSQLLGLKTSGLGGLLGGLFGGMQQRQGLGALLGMVPGVGAASAVSPALGYNAAYSQTPTGDGQGNNAFSSSDGYWGGARSLTD